MHINRTGYNCLITLDEIDEDRSGTVDLNEFLEMMMG
jgi:hypothetical protein